MSKLKIGFGIVLAAVAVGVFIRENIGVSEQSPQHQQRVEKIKVSNYNAEDKTEATEQAAAQNDAEFEFNVSDQSLKQMTIAELGEYADKVFNELPAEKQAFVLQEMKKAKDRDSKNGYFGEEDREAYDSYDTSTLEAMGDQGDLLALDVLNRRYIKDEGGLKKSLITNYKSLHYGASKGAVDIADKTFKINSEDAFNGKLNSDVYTALAYYQIAIDMGDRFAKGARQRALKRSAIVLTPQQIETVTQLKQELEKAISNNRERMGISYTD